MSDAAPTPDAPARSSARRSWPQRLTVAAAIVAAVGSFAAAGALAAGQWVVSSRNLVVLDDQPDPDPDAAAEPGDTAVIVPDEPGGGDGTAAPAPAPATTPPATFPPVEPAAKNFLITGADGNACIDADSRFAAAFGDVHGFGDRSDTIMVWRVNPGAAQVAVLSFPRDLYVTIDGTRQARINNAYERDDPKRLRATLLDNFGISTDHYIQVDFCAFKRLVDAVGGVEVPFEYPARDTRTGLSVPEVGCYNFEGDHALAYVRSRRYQYEDPPGSGNWITDGTSDLGRIARQQDFLRRTVASVLGRGVYSPSVVSALIETNREHLTVDSELTVDRMLEFAGVLRSLDPDAIASYQIESSPQMRAGNAVLIPRIDGDNMQSILAVFRGEALLADAPEQELRPTTTTAPRPSASESGDDEPGDDEPGSDEPGDRDDESGTRDDESGDDVPTAGATTTLPEVRADENLLGIAPPRNISCN